MVTGKFKKVLAGALALTMVMTGLSVAEAHTTDAVSAENTNIVYGADIGDLSQLESMGVSWVDDNGNVDDALEILKDKGVTAVRIRAFVNPDSSFTWTKDDGSTCILGYVDTQGVLYTAQRAAELGMKIDLVFHYSDHYADPQYQDIPGQWESASATELSKYVYDYTYYLMNELAAINIYPEWVEVGNEINSGILLPYGSSTDNFQQLTEYLNSGYDAVKAVSPNSQVVTHLAYIGNGYTDFTWFFDQFLNTYGGKTDIIGASYYPYWAGSNDIEEFTKTLYICASRYDKGVMICETGGDENDAAGTCELLREEINALDAIPNGKGVGVFYWEPEVNSESVPDGYALGATRKVSDNVYQFTSALDAFSEGVDFLGGEVSFEIQNRSTEKAMNIRSGSWDNSAVIEQYGYGTWDSQKWYLVETENGYYKIVSKLTGKVLEIDSMSTSSGAACVQYEYNGGWNQMWKLVETTDGAYKLQNRLSGLYLGVQNASSSDGAAIVQMNDDDSNIVKWYLLVTE